MNPIKNPKPFRLNHEDLFEILMGCDHRVDEGYGHSFYYCEHGFALLECNEINQVVWFYERVYHKIYPSSQLYCSTQWRQVPMERGEIRNQIIDYFETIHGWTPDRIFRHMSILT